MYHLDKKQIQEITDYIFLEDRLERADAIFIPGCARPEHTEEAARVYKEGYAPLLLPSGGYTKVQGSFQGVSKEGQKYGRDFACEAGFLEAFLLHGLESREEIEIFFRCSFTSEWNSSFRNFKRV